MLYIIVVGFLGLLFVYLQNRQKIHIPQMPPMRHENVPYPSVTSRNIGRFFADQKIPYVLDVRSDEESRLSGLRHANSTVLVYIPLIQDQEREFIKSVFNDSRMLTAREENREFLVVCSHGKRSALACTLLQEFGFRPVNLYDGLVDVHPQYLRGVV